jgi:predicted regulator of Ras-like GTPase activity (Roadblock/LC7/MglB family)
MSLRETLTTMLEQVEGAYSVMLMGYDCIAIDEIQQGSADFDVQTMAVEYGTVIKEIRRTIEVIGAGEMEEITITTARSRMIIRVLNDEFFAAFVLSKNGNLGKARYLLRAKALELIQAVE